MARVRESDLCFGFIWTSVISANFASGRGVRVRYQGQGDGGERINLISENGKIGRIEGPEAEILGGLVM